MKPRLACLLALLIVLLAAFLVPMLMPDIEPAVSRENFMQLRMGMTVEEAIETLGQPTSGELWEAAYSTWVWKADGIEIVVEFNGGLATAKLSSGDQLITLPNRERSFFERFRKWVRN